MAKGGEIGMRPAERLPDVFVEVVRPLAVRRGRAELLRTGAGFHVLKLVDRRDAGALTITQTRARHILLRASPQVSQEAALRRLADLKRQIVAGTLTFEQAARDNSEDAQRGAGRRPRLGLAGHVRARVRAGDEPAAARRPSPTRSCRASACTCSR